MLAVVQATMYNAHFRGATDAEYLASDFMGTTNRQERQAKLNKQRAHDQIDLTRARLKMARMKPNVEPEDLPEWARR